MTNNSEDTQPTSQETPGKQNGPASQADLKRVEQVLKLFAGAIAVVSALGFPAVVLQFAHYGIPFSFINTQRAVSAGVLPALLLLLFGVYIYSVARSVRWRKPWQLPISQQMILFAPPAIIPVAFFGTSVIMTAYFLSVFLVSEASDLLSIDLGLWDMGIAIGLLVVVCLVLFWLRKPLSRSFARLLKGLWHRLPESAREVGTRIEKSRAGGLSIVFIAFLVVISAREATETLVLSSSSFSAFSVLAQAAFFTSCVYAAMTLDNLDLTSREPLSSQQAFNYATRAVAPMFATGVLLYSVVLYPSVPSYLGGGKTQPITVWVEKGAVPSRGEFPGLPVLHEEGELVRIEALHLLEANEAHWILVRPNFKSRPWMAFPASVVKAFSRPTK